MKYKRLLWIKPKICVSFVVMDCFCDWTTLESGVVVILLDCRELGDIWKKFRTAVIGVLTGLKGKGEEDGEWVTTPNLDDQQFE